MDLLLDTHTFIWFLNGDSQLPPALKTQIADISNRCFLSIASLWEIAIKVNLGKLDLQGDFSQIARFLEENEIEVLPITIKHTERLRHLELHHRDPFDRMIIAQALSENLPLATKDEAFIAYGVRIVWK